jgi:hypothetical protein
MTTELTNEDQKHPDYYEFVYRVLVSYISNSDDNSKSAEDVFGRGNLSLDDTNEALEFMCNLTDKYKDEFVKSLEEFGIAQENC